MAFLKPAAILFCADAHERFFEKPPSLIAKRDARRCAARRASSSCVSLWVLGGTFEEAQTGDRALFIALSPQKGPRMTRQTELFTIPYREHGQGIRAANFGHNLLILSALIGGSLCAQATTTAITNQPPPHMGWESFCDVPLPPRQEETRFFKAEITFTATSSNNVQMAFGKDIDKDGKLPAEETSATVGWDRGAWFILSHDLLHTFTCVPQDASTATSRTLKVAMRLSANGTPLSLSFKDGAGNPLTFEGLEGIPTWMSPKDWDTAALTARGWDARDEQATFSFVLDGTQIRLR